MDVLVCVKRVPTVGGTITLSADGLSVDTRMSGFTISPHEECAVEEAVRLVERFGGSVTVVTLGPAEAEEQLRSCLALGASAGVLLETDGPVESSTVEFGAIGTAAALHSVAADGGFDLVLLGNEAADTADYQVGIRLAHLLGWPVATGIKALTVDDAGTTVAARREYRGAGETYTLPLPCVLTVREGINLPRYPSLPGRLRAKRAVISRVPAPFAPDARLRTTALRVPAAARRQATVLGHGADAIPALVSVLAELGVLS
jgi:electron transfer flavoprotein beta subunit